MTCYNNRKSHLGGFILEINLKEAGKRVREIRIQHNYSMAIFATLVGNSSASTVNNWEKGNNLPRQERLEKIAILGNTTADWIRYGEFEDYVKQLLSEANLEKNLTEKQFEELIIVLHEKKITYTQDLKILTAANKLFPDLFETSYQLTLSEQKASLIFEDSVTYRIEQNDRYRNTFLPRIEELLYDSAQKEVNGYLIALIFDLIKRTEAHDNFSSLSQIFTILSDILTDDISYKNKPATKIVDYTNLTKNRTGKKLSEKTIAAKYAQSKNELLQLLDEFQAAYNKK